MRWLSSILHGMFHGRAGGRFRAAHLARGARGEEAAMRYLKRRGHRILSRNYEDGGGELDLVTRDGDTVVIVEVKARRDDEAGDPREAAGPVKWSRVERTARRYRARHRLEEAPFRFDLVTVVWRGKNAHVEHVENAYEARGF